MWSKFKLRSAAPAAIKNKNEWSNTRLNRRRESSPPIGNLNSPGQQKAPFSPPSTTESYRSPPPFPGPAHTPDVTIYSDQTNTLPSVDNAHVIRFIPSAYDGHVKKQTVTNRKRPRGPTSSLGYGLRLRRRDESSHLALFDAHLRTGGKDRSHDSWPPSRLPREIVRRPVSCASAPRYGRTSYKPRNQRPSSKSVPSNRSRTSFSRGWMFILESHRFLSFSLAPSISSLSLAHPQRKGATYRYSILIPTRKQTPKRTQRSWMLLIFP